MRKTALVFLPLLLGLVACVSHSTPATPVALPTSTSPTPTDTPVPSPTLWPTATPTLAAIVPPTLPMSVGATYLYVDGGFLVAVPAGEFIMGHGGADNPVHTVSLDDFWIYRAPVTNRQYAACVAAGQCTPPDPLDNPVFDNPYRANDPVVGVTWEQAADYCRFVHGRLPTEAEWEKTARGPEGNLYPWGDAAPSCHLANLAGCVGTTSDVTTHPLGKSYYGALDMAGNTFEWVADWYSPTYYTESPYENPFGPEVGQKRSVRSSGFSAPFYHAEAARRSFADPLYHHDDLGFRCVVEDPTYFAPYCTSSAVLSMPPQTEASFTEVCPSISISQNQYCGPGDTPLTNVVFHGPAGATIDSGGCSPLGGNTYLCSEPTTVQICADCTLTGTLTVTCPPGYALDEATNTCQIEAAFPGNCLPGFIYDSEEHCCRKGDAVATGDVFACPEGTYYANPPGACVPFPAAGTVCESENVSFRTCEHRTEDDSQGSCSQPPGSACPPNSSWDASLCCCYDPVAGTCR